METQASFDLNNAIQNWRGTVGQSSAFRTEDLDELESHLRDSVATLQARGLSGEETFLIATRRIGRNRVLEPEFAKVNPNAIWVNRMLWMLIGYQVWTLVTGLVSAIMNNAVIFGTFLATGGMAGASFKSSHNTGSHADVTGIILFTLVNLLGFVGSLALCWWIFTTQGRRINSRAGRLMQKRSSFIICFLGFCLVMLSGSVANYLMRMVQFKKMSLLIIGNNAMSQNYSTLIVYPLQVAILAAFTLMLLRAGLRKA